MVTADPISGAASTSGAPSAAATREQLRRLIRAIEARPTPTTPAAPHQPLAPALPLEQALPGAWVRDDAGLLTTTRVHELDHLHGTQPLHDLRTATGPMLALLGRDAALGRRTLGELLFLDIETTGLGGAGAMVFLVTTGRVEADRFMLRQYLAPSPAEEGTLLVRLIADCLASSGRSSAERPLLVTYNGRTFDAPMLDQRATMHRMRAGFEALDHLDLLATVRRGFRGLLPSCRLAQIEVTALGVTRPSDEVSGAEVPAWYFRFLRGGDARYIAPLIAHNAYDVLSLAALTGRLAAVASSSGTAHPTATAARPGTAIERLAAGRLWLSAGQAASIPGDYLEASAHLEAAAAALDEGWPRDEALLTLATLHRRAGRREAAAALWAQLAHRPGAARVQPLTELAKYQEHTTRDPAAALEMVDHAIAAGGETPELAHRRDRLQRKLGIAS